MRDYVMLLGVVWHHYGKQSVWKLISKICMNVEREAIAFYNGGRACLPKRSNLERKIRVKFLPMTFAVGCWVCPLSWAIFCWSGLLCTAKTNLL